MDVQIFGQVSKEFNVPVFRVNMVTADLHQHLLHFNRFVVVVFLEISSGCW